MKKRSAEEEVSKLQEFLYDYDKEMFVLFNNIQDFFIKQGEGIPSWVIKLLELLKEQHEGVVEVLTHSARLFPRKKSR